MRRIAQCASLAMIAAFIARERQHQAALPPSSPQPN